MFTTMMLRNDAVYTCAMVGEGKFLLPRYKSFLEFTGIATTDKFAFRRTIQIKWGTVSADQDFPTIAVYTCAMIGEGKF